MIIKVVRGLAVLTLAVFSQMSYAQCEDAEYVVTVDADVGLWDAIWAGGYVEAAYDQLGEDLASRSYLDDAEVIYLNFVYTVHIVFWSGTGVTTNICLIRDGTQNWTDVANDLVDTTDSDAAAGDGAEFDMALSMDDLDDFGAGYEGSEWGNDTEMYFMDMLANSDAGGYCLFFWNGTEFVLSCSA